MPVFSTGNGPHDHNPSPRCLSEKVTSLLTADRRWVYRKGTFPVCSYLLAPIPFHDISNRHLTDFSPFPTVIHAL